MQKFSIGDIAYVRVKILQPESLGATVEVVDDKGRPWDNGPQWFAEIHMVAKKKGPTTEKAFVRAAAPHIVRAIKKSKKPAKRSPKRKAKRRAR